MFTLAHNNTPLITTMYNHTTDAGITYPVPWIKLKCTNYCIKSDNELPVHTIDI